MRTLLFLLGLCPLLVLGQNTDGDQLFGSPGIKEVHLDFADPAFFDSLTAYFGSDINMPATLTIDGTGHGPVGVQFKGNSSYNGPGDKKPFKVDINAFDDANRVDGEKKFILNNGFKDPSFLREKLALDLMNANGINAPRCTYAKLFLNGSYWGLYTLVEAVDKTFLDNRFNDNEGNLFKGDPSGDLRWYGSAQSGYYNHFELHTNEAVNDWSDLVHAIDVINNTPAATFPDSVHARFKTQSLLRAWAANNLLVNLDSYLGSGHNYYLYHDSTSTEWRWLNWDVNEAFGNFQMSLPLAQLRTLPLDHVAGPPGGRPLYQKALADPTLRAEYIEQLCDLVRNGVDTVALRTKADSLRAVIDQAVLTDTHKFYTYQQFRQNNELDINQTPGVLSFLRDRVDFLDAALTAAGCITGLPDATGAMALETWPVPADDVLHVRAAETMTASLYDLQGRPVAKADRSSTMLTIGTSDLAPGLYVLALFNGRGSLIAQQRVVILH